MSGKKRRGSAMAVVEKEIHGRVTGEQNIKLSEEPCDGYGFNINTNKAEEIFAKFGKDTEVLVNMRVQGIAEDRVRINQVKVIKPEDMFSVIIPDASIPKDMDEIENISSCICEAFGSFDIEMRSNEVLNRISSLVNSKNSFYGVKIVDKAQYLDCLEFKRELKANLNNISILVQIVDSVIYQSKACIDIYELARFNDDKDDVDFGNQWEDNYYIPESIRPLIPVIFNIVNGKTPYYNLILLGESGSGKTSFAAALAQQLGFNYAEVNCAMITDPEQWFIERGARDGSTFTEQTIFSDALQQGNCVICLDEINRLKGDLANPLLPILDDRRYFEVAGNQYPLGSKIVFVMSANIGFQYSGTFSIDAALRNRAMAACKFGDLPLEIEEELIARLFGFDTSMAMEIASMFNRVRNIIRGKDANDHNGNYTDNIIGVDVSTRALINLSRLIANGMTMPDAITFSIVNNIPDDVVKPKDLLDFLSREFINEEASAKRRFVK
jgi:MoxR-like ATPase